MKINKKEGTVVLTWIIIFGWLYLIERYLLNLDINISVYILGIAFKLISLLPIVLLCIYYRKDVSHYFNFKSKLLLILLLCVFLTACFINMQILKTNDMELLIYMGLELFIGCFFEETYFRGLLYSTLKKSRGRSWAIFISSLMFALSHIYRMLDDSMAFAIFYMVALMFIAYIFAYLFEVTDNLWIAVLCHSMYNLNFYLGITIMIFLLIWFKVKRHKQKQNGMNIQS